MIAASLISKIDEQIERTAHLIALTPALQLGWTPPIPGAWPVGVVIGHLLDCLAGFCAVLHAAYPDALAHFAKLRGLPVNAACDPREAYERIAEYRAHIHEGLALLTDDGLARKISTIFAAEGESVMTLLLGNLEHLINHKHQLFMYLKLMDVNVASRDLYRFR